MSHKDSARPKTAAAPFFTSRAVPYRLRLHTLSCPVLSVPVRWAWVAKGRLFFELLWATVDDAPVAGCVIDVERQCRLVSLEYVPSEVWSWRRCAPGVDEGRFCVACGCSELDGCEDGCAWVPEGLGGWAPVCSACFDSTGAGSTT